MHAVVTRITVNDREAAPIQMRENVVPAVSQSPGFRAGYWTGADDGTGLSMVIFESEEAATNLSERVPSILSDAVTIDSIEVREVVAHA
jgi:heme-degrading monooxygenase HmoA